MDDTLHISPASTQRRITPAIPFAVGVALAVATIGMIVAQAQPTAGTSGAPADTSYDQVERVRSGLVRQDAADTSYDQVENLRMQVLLPQSPADRRYDALEEIRAQRGG